MQDHAPEITHDQQVEQYFKSTFCPVISGDSQVSCGRLSHAMLMCLQDGEERANGVNGANRANGVDLTRHGESVGNYSSICHMTLGV
jgi:hypothetical protein